MAKRTHFTTVTPLPAGITRETVLSTLHCHTEMIDLNPLVIDRHPIRPPPIATPEEAHCSWYSITDKIAYLPAGLYTGSLNFQACFHDLEDGLQTRICAPMGLDMRGRWTLGGTLPGEKIIKQEMGLGMPKQGLWLREDVDMKVNFVMTTFVKKTTKKAHSALVERLIEKSHIKEADTYNAAIAEQISLRESYPPDYHSGILSPGGASASTGTPYARDSQYSAMGTGSSDTASLRSSQGGGGSVQGHHTGGSSSIALTGPTAAVGGYPVRTSPPTGPYAPLPLQPHQHGHSHSHSHSRSHSRPQSHSSPPLQHRQFPQQPQQHPQYQDQIPIRPDCSPPLQQQQQFQQTYPYQQQQSIGQQQQYHQQEQQHFQQQDLHQQPPQQPMPGDQYPPDHKYLYHQQHSPPQEGTFIPESQHPAYQQHYHGQNQPQQPRPTYHMVELHSEEKPPVELGTG